MNIDILIAQATRTMGDVRKSETADAGKYKYDYATLNDVLATVEAGLSTVDLVMMQPINYLGDGFAQIVTRVGSVQNEEWIEFPGTPFKVMGDPQATGSAITYARRYSLVTLFALSVHDDDGQHAKRAETQPGQRTEAEKMVRQMVEGLPDKMAKEDFQVAFKEQFGSTLISLSENRHGDALGWAKAWIAENMLGVKAEPPKTAPKKGSAK